MTLTTDQLKDLLVGPGHVRASDFALAVTESGSGHESLWNVLVDKDLIQDRQLGQLVAAANNWHWLDLGREKIDQNIFLQVPEIVARHRGILAVSRSAAGVKLAMTDPTDLATIHLLEKRLGDAIRPFYTTPRELQLGLAHYRNSLKDEF